MDHNQAILLIIFILIKLITTVDIKCDPEISSKGICKVMKVVIAKGDAVNYININPNITTIDFSFCEMIKIPTQLFANFTKLDSIGVERVGLKQLLFNDLKDNHLLYFVLDNNGIKVLKNGVFKGNPLLKSMTISNNKLQKISTNTFIGLSRLTFLWMDNNQIKAFSNGALYHLTALDWLNLEYNNLTTIPKNLFK